MGGRPGDGFLAPTLFLCLFAGQAGVIALSPVLPEVAADLGVSVATAGQLRAVGGLTAGLAALAMGLLSGRLGLRNVLVLGLALLAAGSLVSAGAPSFAMLAAGQVVVGAGLALVLAAGPAAAAEWTTAEQQPRVLSWTLVGQPGAWIVGMPVIGLLGDVSWRLGWLAVPLLASIAALLALALRPADPPSDPGHGSWALLRHDRVVAGWAAGEMLAFSAWAGSLVYAGALFIESYGISPGGAGLLLGAAAIAYLPGNFIARRHVTTASRELLIATPLLAAAFVAVFGAYRPQLWVSALIFALLVFAGGARTIAGSARGLEVCSQRRLFAMRIRAAATQFGYLLGAALGGLALAASGYAAVGAVFAALFALASVPPLLVRPAADATTVP